MKSLRFSVTFLVTGAVTMLWSGAQFAEVAPATSPAPAVPAPTAAAASPNRTPLPPRTPEGAITPVQKDAKRHQQFLDRVKQGGIDLLFVGDSITDFWNRVGEKSWLKFAPLNPGNIAISGNRTEHVLWGFEHGELEGISPKLAVVMIGTNNLGTFPDEKPEWAAAGVKKILDTLRKKLPEMKILLLAIFPRADAHPGIQERITKVNEIIATYADGKTIRFLDIGKVFLDEQDNIPSEIMPDKLHPSAFGYDRWYDAVHPTIDEMMK
jgi:GDSL-like Lipase/Acylhydrolase family